MSKDLNSAERSFLKLVEHFKKRMPALEDEGKMDDTLRELVETSEKLATQVLIHAENRTAIQENHEQLKGMVRDNAKCPRCSSSEHLKLSGTEKNDKGWVSNKYRCRRCNITFVWNAPNNPWDMIPYVEDMIRRVEEQFAIDPNAPQATIDAIGQMRENIEKLKPVVHSSDEQMRILGEREEEMAGLISTVSKHLMIQKIRLED